MNAKSTKQYGAAVPGQQVARRTLIPLGHGVYTITETCRILQPTMTRAKVHYWLNTGLLSEPPIAHRGPGIPTLLTYRQLLEVRTVQYLRDELKVSLPRVREAFSWLLQSLFVEAPTDVRFELGPGPSLIATAHGESVVVPTGQGALGMDVDDLNDTIAETRLAWEEQAFVIPTHPAVVSNTYVLAGAPTVVGTRIDTALIAAFAGTEGYGDDTVRRVLRLYPQLSAQAVVDALEFEGVRPAA